MNNSIAQWCGIVVAIVIAAIAAFGGPGDANVGNKTASFWDVGSSYKILGTIVHDATTLKTTTAGGTLTVLTSDTATSTASLGCIQATATSTATPVKFRIGNLNTAASSTYASGSAGFVTWAYGNCP